MDHLAPEHEDELLTRRERLRAQRQGQHSAPARISVRFGAVAFVLIGLLSWIVVSWISSRPAAEPLADVVAVDTASVQPEQDEEGGQENKVVMVHVAGAVVDPRVTQLRPGDRVIDAVEAAGGFTEEAAPEGVNLAAAAEDGTLIFVPTVEELESGVEPPTADDRTQGHGSGGAQQSETVNLNTADAGELEQLPGVGPALADRIITYREAHGQFSALEELAAVSGIGPAILENIVDDVTW